MKHSKSLICELKKCLFRNSTLCKKHQMKIQYLISKRILRWIFFIFIIGISINFFSVLFIRCSNGNTKENDLVTAKFAKLQGETFSVINTSIFNQDTGFLLINHSKDEIDKTLYLKVKDLVSIFKSRGVLLMDYKILKNLKINNQSHPWHVISNILKPEGPEDFYMSFGVLPSNFENLNKVILLKIS